MDNSLYRKIAYGMAVVAMFFGVLFYAIKLFGGNIDFSEWQLPGNVFDCPNLLAWIIGIPSAVIGIPWGLGIWSSDNTKAYDVYSDGSRRENAGDTCMYQLMGLILQPLLAAGAIFAAIYYVLYLIVLLVAAILPWLILLVVVAVAGAAAWIGWKQLETMETKRFFIAAVALMVVYGALAIGMSASSSDNFDDYAVPGVVAPSDSLEVDSVEVQ